MKLWSTLTAVTFNLTAISFNKGARMLAIKARSKWNMISTVVENNQCCGTSRYQQDNYNGGRQL